MTKLAAILAVLAFLTIAQVANADTLSCTAGTCSVSTTGLNDLEEGTAWTWKITTPANLLTGENIVSASLTFNNIKNVDYGVNTLNVYLLDTATHSGAYEVTTNEGNGDYFSGSPMFTKSSIPSTPTTVEFDFTTQDLGTLATYIGNGDNFAFGIDPDCHFYDSNVTFQMKLSSVPEPGSILLLGTLVIAITAGLRRRLS